MADADPPILPTDGFFDNLDGFDLDSIPYLQAPSSSLPATQVEPSQSHQLTAQPQDLDLASSTLPHAVEHDTSHAVPTISADNSSEPTATTTELSDSTKRSTTPSTDYGLEDDVDEDFLKEVDKLENELLSQVTQHGACRLIITCCSMH